MCILESTFSAKTAADVFEIWPESLSTFPWKCPAVPGSLVWVIDGLTHLPQDDYGPNAHGEIALASCRRGSHAAQEVQQELYEHSLLTGMEDPGRDPCLEQTSLAGKTLLAVMLTPAAPILGLHIWQQRILLGSDGKSSQTICGKS